MLQDYGASFYPKAFQNVHMLPDVVSVCNSVLFGSVQRRLLSRERFVCISLRDREHAYFHFYTLSYRCKI